MPQSDEYDEVDDFDEWVQLFAFRDRRDEALAALMAAGAAATPAVRRGLRHADDQVKLGCLQVLDHYLDEDALGELVECLASSNGEVRRSALHALSCERCKEGECRPGEGEVRRYALAMLAGDRYRKARQEAAAYLGRLAPIDPDVAAALEAARDGDPNPTVRKVAGWYAPGGTLFAKKARALLIAK